MAEKIKKLVSETDLDQMLEDIAGEEFDDYNESESVIGQDFNQLFENEDFSRIDQLH